MVYILFIVILILFIKCFFLFKKNILNPSVILCGVFLVSLFFYILNLNKWKVNIQLNTFLIILGTIIIFIVGNTSSYLILLKRNFDKKEKYIKKISLKTVSLINIILIILLYKYFKEIYRISLIGGNPGDYKLFLYYARIANLNFIEVNRIMIYSIYMVKAISYIFFFLFSYITIKYKFIFKNLYYLSPTIIYSGFIILSAGRGEFIFLLIYMMLVFFILYEQKYNFCLKVTKRIIFYSIISLILFFIIFSLAGLLTGKTQTRSIFEMISIYTGSSLPALDIYMNSPKIPNKFFGEHTLFTIHRILRIIGYKEIPQLYPHYEFVSFGGIETNVYSAIRRYHEDFGVAGLFFLTFLLGLLYGVFYRMACGRNRYFLLILYASTCYPIFMFAIDDIFLRGLFPIVFLYNFIALSIVYYIFIQRNFK